MPDLTDVDRLLAEARRLRSEARDLNALAVKATMDALAAVPEGIRLDYVFTPAGQLVFSVTRTETGWVDRDGGSVDPEWVDRYWTMDSLHIHRPDGDDDA
jgi:hypothetical protein